MKQLTIRDVGPDLHQAIKEAARQRGMSMNRYVLLLLRRAAGLDIGRPQADREFHDLDHLAGSWTAVEYEQFEEALSGQRIVEADLWR